MACNCNDKGNIYNISMGCCVPVVANADNYYTKDEVDEKLEEVVISGGGVTHNEMENYVTSYTYDKATINEMIVSGGTFDPTKYYTTNETDERIVSATSAVNNELTAHTSNNNIHVTAQDKNNWNAKSDFSGSYNDLTDKPTIPTVPTDVSAFNNDAGYLTQHQSLSGYATEQYVQNYTYDKATIDEKVAGGGTFDPTQYYTTANTYNKTEVDNLIPTIPTSNTAFTNDAGYITSDAISGKADTSAVTESINAAVSGKVDASTYNAYTAATATEIGNKLPTSAFSSYSGAVDTAINSKASQSDLNALTDVVSAHTANTNIHVTAQDKTNWNNKSNFSGSYNDLTDKPTIPTVPTDVSAFNNDAGYITSAALSGYAESSAVTQEISAAVSGKMDTSAFTAYSAATDTVISNKADSSALNNYILKSKIWCGTQNEYDSIQNKDAETLYLIHS